MVPAEDAVILQRFYLKEYKDKAIRLYRENRVRMKLSVSVRVQFSLSLSKE